MAKLLSLDSSAQLCSVALSIDGSVSLKVDATPRQHAQRLLPMVDQLLNDADLPLSALDAIAFGRGPGSFTGIRIGMSVVQGLAMGADLPVVPVSTLQALAVAAYRERDLAIGDIVLPAFDARMNEVYFGEYRIAEDVPEPLAKEQVIAIPSWLKVVQDKKGLAVGDGWQLTECETVNQARDCVTMSITAQDINVIAQHAFDNGRVVPFEAAEPVYLRNEVTWKKRETVRRARSDV